MDSNIRLTFSAFSTSLEESFSLSLSAFSNAPVPRISNPPSPAFFLRSAVIFLISAITSLNFFIGSSISLVYAFIVSIFNAVVIAFCESRAADVSDLKLSAIPTIRSPVSVIPVILVGSALPRLWLISANMLAYFWAAVAAPLNLPSEIAEDVPSTSAMRFCA